MINLMNKIINEEIIEFFYNNKKQILELFNSMIPENVMINGKDYGRKLFGVNTDKQYLYIKSNDKLDIGIKIYEVKLCNKSMYKIYGMKYKNFNYVNNGFEI